MTWRGRLERLWSALCRARRGLPGSSGNRSTDLSEGGVPTPPPPTFVEALETGGSSWPEWWQNFSREPNRLYADLSATQVELLRARDADRIESTIHAAEKILEHRFQLLGSEEFVPSDAERSPRTGSPRTTSPRMVRDRTYTPIQWRYDPTSGQTFPGGFPHQEWSADRTPPGADIKLPWELGRGQHWTTLAQAYRLTGRREFAREILDQWLDFGEAHPTDGQTGEGILWVCTMDVAIRAANAALALNSIRDAEWTEDEIASEWSEAIALLFAHGHFMRNNLEDHYEVTSNHFLSNVVGLQFVAEVFSTHPDGESWAEFSRRRVATEIDVQVLPDGADFESSVPYHRLVTELFLASGWLARRCDRPHPESYDKTLGRMVEFLAAVERPDHRMPQSGDADDGRFHILTDYSVAAPEHCTHLYGPAGAYFNRTEWTERGGMVGHWERVLWGFETPQEVASATPPPAVSAHFPDSGLTVHRHDGDYLLISNGRVGTEGFGNHKHNDLLSFELHLAGQPLIVDPGTGGYTGTPALRNAMRSVSSHNTLQVDGHEQNEFKPEWLFRMFETSKAQHLTYEAADTETLYVGRHSGYARFDSPSWHERGFSFDSESGVLYISDHLFGPGDKGAQTHSLRWHFHLAPGVDATEIEGGLELRGGDVCAVLAIPPGLVVEIGDGVFSPSYGAGTPCRTIDLREESPLAPNERHTWFFAVGLDSWYRRTDREQVMLTARKRLEARVREASSTVSIPEVETPSLV